MRPAAGAAAALMAFLGLLVATGCSTSNFDSPMSLVGPDGRHAPGWLDEHGPFAAPQGQPCAPCHGVGLDGGITRVSCFTSSRGQTACHPQGPAFHPDAWTDKSFRGTPLWHATAFADGQTIRGMDCIACHTPPDLDAAGGWCRRCHFDMTGSRDPGTGYAHGQIAGHSDTPTLDEAVCVLCHEVNNRFGHGPFCHNCHEPFPGRHPDGWAAAGAHGHAAKSAPGAETGFAFCRFCHGQDFAGGSAVACSIRGCHAVSGGLTVPHPAGSRWRGESAPTHTSTASGNAPVCFNCHADGANSGLDPANPPPGTVPGCFNGTLCHYREG